MADTLGLKLDNDEVSWENLFVGLDSGKFDAVFSNVTVTEERKEKYDFATYRLDNIAFEAKKGTDWKVDGPEDVAGKTIAVASGTNQEKILVDWSKQNEKAGRKAVDHQVLPEGHGLLPRPPVGPYRRLPRPQPVRRVPRGHGGADRRSSARSPAPATTSRARSPSTTKKGSGLVDAYAAALNHVIENGSYGRVLKRWGLSSEAVPKSEINPPGLPKI